ncbi:MAG: TetR/AcrR family transcriptional regulator [Rhodocyclaceae bacterium]
MTRTRTAKRKPALDRAAWIRAAVEVLAEEGVGGLRIEVLAKRLHVTKGSFYWHFRDRRALLDEVAAQWKAGRIQDILEQTRARPGHELERIHHVIDVYASARNRKGIRIELAMRDWARREARAAAVVAEVDAIRLECAKKLFAACGLSEPEASARSMLLYAYVFGCSLMSYERFAPDVDRLKGWIAERIAP